MRAANVPPSVLAAAASIELAKYPTDDPIDGGGGGGSAALWVEEDGTTEWVDEDGTTNWSDE